MDIIKSIEHEQLKSKIPVLNVGDTVRVHVKIKEGNRERIQVFEGIIIKKQGGGLNETFTVRRISYGVGVEKTFLVHSPLVEKVEVVRVGKARRAKLYYLRDRVGKAAKTKEKVGARIATEMMTVKEEAVEAPAEAEVVEEVATPAETEVSEEVAATEPEATVVAEAPKAEQAEVAKTAEAPEEAPAVETEAVVKEEVVDTVKEETVEEVKEEASEENKAE